ncbi:MAG: NAD(P)/FAD-dependent oxidoreductase [Lachnospiraceae bacterium]|nr:NAD(P)/FAD-dependent oxidoreductase [Lachnospiraceae bacterium]
MYDAVIIGAGVIGSAIARELSRFDLNICVIEKDEDVCNGTSKANSAIIHAGFDAVPGTLKARFNVLGNRMMDTVSKELDIPFKRCGSLVTCLKGQDRSELEKLLKRGEENGVTGLKILNRNEILEIEPGVSDEVEYALFAPTGGIVCPFNMTIAYAENAFTNGVSFKLNTEVTNITKENDHYNINTLNHEDGNKDVLETKLVINAAGVYADKLNNMVSEKKLHITARKGEYLLLDKEAGNTVSHTIFQLPGAMGKGVLVTPTVHGNLLVGPTAKDIEDKEGVNTTAEGLERVSKMSGLSVKNVPLRQVITSFAGLRAHEDSDDFIIGEAPDAKGFINVAGIESPGLSSAPAIGVYVSELVEEMIKPNKKADFNPIRKGILNPETLTLEERNKLIKEKPAYGNIICRCEMVTEGEIIDAITRPLGARSLDGIKRRTRAGMGRCQAGFCSPRSMEILQRETGMSIYKIGKNGPGSEFVVGRNKEI